MAISYVFPRDTSFDATTQYVHHKGDWIYATFGDDVTVLWNASTYGYGVDKQIDQMWQEPKYGIWRRVGPNQGRVVIGVVDSPEEVVAMLRLLIASGEHDERPRR